MPNPNDYAILPGPGEMAAAESDSEEALPQSATDVNPPPIAPKTGSPTLRPIDTSPDSYAWMTPDKPADKAPASYDDSWMQPEVNPNDMQFGGKSLAPLVDTSTRADQINPLTEDIQRTALGTLPQIDTSWMLPPLAPGEKRIEKPPEMTPYARPGILGGPENFLGSAMASGANAIGYGLEGLGIALNNFNNDTDPNDDATNSLNTSLLFNAGLDVRKATAQYLGTDPDRPISGALGTFAGYLAPMVAAKILGGPLVEKAVSAGTFGGQMETEAHERGASPAMEDVAGAAGVALGSYMPFSKALEPAQAMASSSWNQIAKNGLMSVATNGLKSYLPILGINEITGQVGNLTAAPSQQQTQKDILYNAVQSSWPALVFGGATGLAGQGMAEAKVSAIANDKYGKEDGSVGPSQYGGPAQDKAALITTLSKTADALANDPTKTPQQKMAAMQDVLSPFSPQAQQVLMAHVQNVGSAVSKISALVKAAQKNAPAAPLATQALLAQQVGAVSADAADKAQTIEEQAQAEEEAKQAEAEKALAAQPEPEAEAAPEPEETKPEVPPNATALQEKLAKSPDPDIATRGQQLAEERAALVEEATTTPSEVKKAEVTQELVHNDEATHALAQEPEEVPPPKEEPKPEPVVPAPQGTLHFSEQDGKPYYVPDEGVLPTIKVEPNAEPPQTEEPARPAETVQSAPAAEVPHGTAESVEPKPAPEQRAVQQGEVAPAQAESQLESDKQAKPVTKAPTPKAEQATLESPAVKPPVLGGMDREQLEATAAAEGHHPDDIAAAKKDSDLRDLITAKRVMDEPETDRNALRQDGKALVDPKFDKLTGKYAKAVQAFFKATKNGGYRKTNRFVMGGGKTAAGQDFSVASPMRRGIFDTALVNPMQLARDIDSVKAWFKGKTKANGKPYSAKDVDGIVQDYLRTVFSEEFVHNIGGDLLYKEWQKSGSPGTFSDYYESKFSAIYDRMSRKARQEVADQYGGNARNVDLSKSSDEIGKATASSIAEEYARMLAQRNILKHYTTEEAQERIFKNKPLRTYFQKIQDRFGAILAAVKGDGKEDAEIEQINNHFKGLLSGNAGQKPAEAYSPANVQPVAARALNPRNPERLRQGDSLVGRGGEGHVPVSARPDGLAQQPQRPQEYVHGYLGYAAQNGLDSESPNTLFKYAKDSGSFISREGLAQIRKGGVELKGGVEHEVYSVPNPDGSANDLVVKTTRAPSDRWPNQRFGLNHDPASYLLRIDQQNKLAPGIDYKVLGVTTKLGSKAAWPSFVTSMKFIVGREPKPEDLAKYLEDRGFKDGGLNDWHHPSGLTLGDVHTGNFIQTPDGRMVPIDVTIQGDVPAPLHEMRPETKVNQDFAGARPLPSPEVADEDHEDYIDKLLDSDIGIEPEKPRLSDKEAAKLVPWDEKGGAEAPAPKREQEERKEPSVQEKREQTWAQKAMDVAHVVLPERLRPESTKDTYSELRDAARYQARRVFDPANRDIAEGNAFTKLVIKAKDYFERKGTMDGFSAAQVARNAVMDDQKHFSLMSKSKYGESPRLDSMAERPDEPMPEEETEGEEGEEPEVKTKGYDASNDEIEEGQKAFEPTGAQGWEPAHTNTPRRLAQEAIRERNKQKLFAKVTPYGRRLMELEADTPGDKSAAYPPWVSKAQKEFGISKAKVMQDWENLRNSARAEASHQGFGAHDFQRLAGAKPLENPNKLGVRMEKMFPGMIAPDDLIHEVKTNKATHDNVEKFIADNGIEKSYHQARKIVDEGRIGAFESHLVNRVVQKLMASPSAYDRDRGANLGTMKSVLDVKAGQHTQADIMWDKLGPDGVLVAYGKIIDPVVEKAKKPLAPVIDPITKALETGKQEAAEATIKKMEGGIFTGYQHIANMKSDKEKPVWHRYMGRTAQALSQAAGDVKSPAVKGALQEFADRMQSNLKALLDQNMADKKPQPKPVKMGPEAKVREMFNNEDQYREAWEFAKQYIDAKYSDHPDVLQQYHQGLEKSLDVPVKLLDRITSDAMDRSGVKISDLVRQWSGTQNRTRDQLVDDLKSRIGLPPDKAKLLGDAINATFNNRLLQARKAEIQKLLQKSGNNRLANSAPDLANKIFQAINLGIPEHEAAWNAVADKLGLPKYDPKVAADLKARAEEIQQMQAEGKAQFKIDRKTSEMLNMLANEEQKTWSTTRKLGEGAMAIFYGNVLGPGTLMFTKAPSEIFNTIAEVGVLAASMLRRGDLNAPGVAMRAMWQGMVTRGIPDMVQIWRTGGGLRQTGNAETSAGVASEYRGGKGSGGADNITERGTMMSDLPGLKKLNSALSLYKYVGRTFYATQAFMYAPASEAARMLVANRIAIGMKKAGQLPDEMTVEDKVRELTATSPELQASFMQQAGEEGLRGNEQKLRARELMEQAQDPRVRTEGEDVGTRATFMQEPTGVNGGMLGAVYTKVIRPMQMDENLKWTKIFVPFARVMTNVLNNQASYTPFGYKGAIRLAETQGDQYYGGKDRAFQQYAKITLGGMAAMTALAGAKYITGNGPSNPDKRKAWLDAGNLPYSINFGGHPIPYKTTPFAIPLAVVGSYSDNVHANPDGDYSGHLVAGLLGSAQFFSNSSFILDMSTGAQILSPSDDDRWMTKFEKMIASTGGAMIPGNQAALKMVDRMYDPTLYKPSDFKGYAMSQVAFLRDWSGRPMLNAFGEEVQKSWHEQLWGTMNQDPAWTALAEMNISPPGQPTPTNKINGKRVTEEQLWNLTKEAGQLFHAHLNDGGLDELREMDHEEAQATLTKWYHQAEKQAKGEPLTDDGE